MKNIFRIIGITFVTFIGCLYLAFLFIVPNKIDLNQYKTDVQKLIKDNTGLSINYDELKLYTTPILEAGVKTHNITVSLPDGSTLFHADKFKGKVFLPNLLWKNVRISSVQVDSPSLNVEIVNGEKYKVAKVYEDLVNKQRREKRLNIEPPKTETQSNVIIDPSQFSITVPNFKLKNYKAVIDDTKAKHKLTLKGNELKLGYYNGKTAKLKTKAQFLSDDKTNIIADLDINTFLPKFKPIEQNEDDEAIFSLPFINPVTEYRAYDLKSNITSKLKIRKDQKDNKIRGYGFLNIDNTTVTMSGLQLPESYFKLQAKGTMSEIDTNLYVTNNEYIKLFGSVDYGKSPFVDLTIKSPKVYLNNVLKIAKAYLDTIHIKNDIDRMTASGYLLSNAHLKTDFTDINSNGKIIIRDGNIEDKNIGLIFNKLNANLFFDNNIFKITNTSMLINNRPLKVSGKIDANSIANFNIEGDKIPLKGLYLAFAPRDIKRDYDLQSGILTLNAKVVGEIKDIAAILKSDLENLIVRDRAGNFVISNKSSHFGIANYAGEMKGKLTNKNFNLTLPKTSSTIKDDLLVIEINDDKIVIKPSDIQVNKNSHIKFHGDLKNYLSTPTSRIMANGELSTPDIAALIGKEATPYLDFKGRLPIKSEFLSKEDDFKFTTQVLANTNNYISPVKFDDLTGKQTLLQLLIEKKGDTIKISKSGLFTRNLGTKFNRDLQANLFGAKEIIELRAMISNITTDPFINIFKITINKTMDGSICFLKRSRFSLSGNTFIFGKPKKPHISGHFEVKNLSMPEILTNIRRIDTNLNSKGLNINIDNINANGSDFGVKTDSTWDLLLNNIISNIRVTSRRIDVNRLMKVSEAATKILSKTEDVPTQYGGITIQNGSIRFNNIKSGKIIARNTTGRISLFNNIFYLNRLNTYPMGGNITGNASMNLANTELKAKVQGKNFDIEKILLDVMDMKDTLSGKLNFSSDITLRGTTMEEQMKTLKGSTKFTVINGQLGPFGKFENFLMSENIRENAFFSSAVGSIISNITTIDTSHFNQLYGQLTFSNGYVNIMPIKSQGNVMSMFIFGKAGLLDNSADIKVRGKLTGSVSDSLGVLSNINPVNLIKNTPGLNIVAAKTFSLFCESVSEEDLKAIPHLGKGKTDRNATKFQIVLRGDTRKPLRMIKSFKWLALDSEIQKAKEFVDTIPEPIDGEENLSVEELIKLRETQAEKNSTQE